MLKSNIQFFPATMQLSTVRTAKSSLEHIQKTIEAQIEYNKFLKERLSKTNTSQHEVFEIIISMFLDLSQVPTSLIKPVPDEDLKRRKQDVIQHIDSDIADFKRLKKLAKDCNNLDNLYLTIHFTLQQWYLGIAQTNSKSVEELLSNLYEGKELKKKVKETMRILNTKSAKSPLMTETIIMSEMLKVLKPEINPLVLRFIDDTEFKSMGNLTRFTPTNEALRGIHPKIEKFLREVTAEKEYLLLAREYLSTTNSIKTLQVSIDLKTSYLALFETMKIRYRLEERMLSMMQEARQKKNTIIAASLELKPTVKSPEEGLPKKTVQAQLESTQEKIHQSLESSPSLTPKVISLVGHPSSDSEVTSDIISEQLKSQIPSSEISSTIPLSSDLEATSPCSDKKQDVSISNDNTKEEDITDDYSSVTDFSIFARKDTTKPQIPVVKTKRNVLNLGKNDVDTYLKVFELIPYDSINLRALVNLTQAFGGTLTTTGANRCRIEIKNIYAHLLIPEETLAKACEKATVTMHGGGHRSKKSQNNDRENAPDYLIEQFKAAFVRAGYTPVNLGLNEEATMNGKLEF
ncbi:hypothetical protein [Legionella hackeliae]|uniref:Uncharacterized protein n=1 Tax=Legionella hackeliae TaxID=449 RepID=A0A0A8UVI1_LEGHA|nr:hypothetical protein [Legionella hackeliae]KTD06653.1 hypothetical protein Lhac_3176 [Legionella hackeliae]CEK10774.1 protein of unknown function [Legionella hackeliae]STX47512.1 Uncharacterised protein [Legionella hackeliae]